MTRLPLIFLALLAPLSGAALQTGASSDEAAVRTARAAFNAAIKRHDADAIASLLAPTYHIVTGRSDQFHGAAAESEGWAARFTNDPTVSYTRTPREVRVNAAWGLAEESGDWAGTYTTSGSGAAASGVYSAKWQRSTTNKWLLQAEVFTTLKCDGPPAACTPPTPIAPATRVADASVPGVQKLKITILSTMLAGDTKGMGEWGFAALLEADGHKLLVDTGARPDRVSGNLAELGIALSDVNELVLTHNHADHTGGLLTLRREARLKNAAALSVAHVGRGIFEPRLTEAGRDQNGLTPLKADYEGLGGTFVEHSEPTQLFPGVWFTGPVPRVHPEHNWSGSLKVRDANGLVEDNVAEDSAIIVVTKQGLVILTGCGHAGIVNIVDYARKRFNNARVYAIVGGLHLFNATDQTLGWTAARLREAGVAHLLGAHCTGIEAVFRLRDLANLTRRTAVVGSVGASFSLESGIDPLALAR